MLSILSGSLTDVIVPSFASSSGADRKGISRISSWVSALSLNRIVHLPVPSEKMSWHGKAIPKSLAPTTGRDPQVG